MRKNQLLETRTAFALASLNTDIEVPGFAQTVVLHWNISAVAGTTPIADCKLQFNDPESTNFLDVDSGAFAQQTAAAYQVMEAGPELTNDATGNHRKVALTLPSNIRFAFTFDRTTADETYTFTLHAEWWGPG